MPTMIDSTGKLGVFSRDTISQMTKSQKSWYQTNQKPNQIPDNAEGIYSVPE